MSSYEIKKFFASEDELWSLFNYFFSPSCKKTSTYKFGFLKAILDNLFSGEMNEKGYALSFDTLFESFAANYWNLITEYHLKQLRFNGASQASIEIVINKIVEENKTLKELNFYSLNGEDRKKVINEVKTKCKRHVIGAMYDNFEGVLYGYSPEFEIIWLNHVSYEFLLKYKLEIEKINYFEWAKKLQELNKNQSLKLLEDLENATPHRNDLAFYRNILKNEFENNNCFYCGKKLEGKVTVDHVIPWKLVREDRIWNFVLACSSCNSKKNDRIPDKKSILVVLNRNEIVLKSSNERIQDECKGYSAEMMLRLWNYAKIGGYKEFIINS